MKKLTLTAAFDRLQQVLPGYEVRQAQLDLARTIERAFAERLPAVCEAPTGVGKSFAGLVPALLSGKRVVIATATIALQDQYLQSDIPVLQKALGKFTAYLVKGRRHYVSLRRLEQSLLAPPELRDWAYGSETGDWAELPRLPSSEIWEDIKSDADDCLGKSCSYYQDCKYFSARRELEKADVLIVNHALLMADHLTGGSLLPPYDLLIVDEAHQFYDYATNAFTSEISNFGIRHLLRRVRKHFGELQIYTNEIETEAQKIFMDLLVNGTNDRPFSPDYVNLIPLFQRLDKLREHLQQPIAGSDTEKQMRQEKILQTLTGYCNHLDHLTHNARNRELINWVHIEGNKQGRELKTALLSTPLDVAPVLQNWLFSSDSPTVIFMSATLSALSQDPFNYFRQQVGLKTAQALEVQLDSPFNYDEQCLLYVPKHLPLPSENIYNQAVAQEVADLLNLSQGRAFVLFTSNKAMLEVYGLVSQQVKWPCKNQDQSSKRALLDWFLTTPNPVLFGVNSLWEGISITGSQLSMVIIDRLPFQSPGDPVYDARCEQLKSQLNRSWFEELALPHAALRLKQGFGRLIRTTTDRGIVTLLDPRLTNKGYGKKLLRSLPSAQLTHRFDPELFAKYLR